MAPVAAPHTAAPAKSHFKVPRAAASAPPKSQMKRPKSALKAGVGAGATPAHMGGVTLRPRDSIKPPELYRENLYGETYETWLQEEHRKRGLPMLDPETTAILIEEIEYA
ncbi:Aste57867_8381 [Aphanomyces stellatus]|uniref:Aste57867_8381 protein n=1 Tax=Aphanomyces stellatus TaxID=120398 RepID=A0A485KK86_9STRA|nr:hypothetical protein As57867_008349 [Aphanomyces stellatus]VFT85267.1 Aste57867_8381 [Aphanomyces stellatus]